MYIRGEWRVAKRVWDGDEVVGRDACVRAYGV